MCTFVRYLHHLDKELGYWFFVLEIHPLKAHAYRVNVLPFVRYVLFRFFFHKYVIGSIWYRAYARFRHFEIHLIELCVGVLLFRWKKKWKCSTQNKFVHHQKKHYFVSIFSTFSIELKSIWSGSRKRRKERLQLIPKCIAISYYSCISSRKSTI